MSTSSAFSDRLCVATNGDFNQLLSAEEITFCCHNCGDGCSGGHPIRAWKRFNKHGLVTGGDYKSDQVTLKCVFIIYDWSMMKLCRTYNGNCK